MPAIIRIVRMTFQPDQYSEFESLFDSVRQNILSMPGCSSLSLKRDASQSNVYYTLSHWGSEESLQAFVSANLGPHQSHVCRRSSGLFAHCIKVDT